MQAMRERGFSHSFQISTDCLLCRDTGNCYPAASFEVVEIHALGAVREKRYIIYGVCFPDGDKGIVWGISRDLNLVQDPKLYAKLLII